MSRHTDEQASKAETKRINNVPLVGLGKVAVYTGTYIPNKGTYNTSSRPASGLTVRIQGF